MVVKRVAWPGGDGNGTHSLHDHEVESLLPRPLKHPGPQCNDFITVVLRIER